MITLEQLQELVGGPTVAAVQRILNGFEMVFSDGSKLQFPAAWAKFEPGKQGGVGGKVKRESGEGAE